MSSVPSIEVVIPTYNRKPALIQCLDALAAQTIAGFSVAVVDDASDERVEDWLSIVSWPFRLRVLRCTSNQGPANARNAAVASSEADLIAFIDDDVRAIPELLSRHLDAWRGAGAGSVIIGPLVAPQDWRPTPWNRWEADTLAFEYRRMAEGIYQPTWRQFFTGNALVSRQDIAAAGGFNASLRRAEDIELAYRLHQQGARFVFQPAAVGHHYAERSLQSWRQMAAQYAGSDLQMDRLYPELEWRRVIQHEMNRRHWLTKTAVKVAGSVRHESGMAALAIAAARPAHRFGWGRVSGPLLSAAFQLEYEGALRTSVGHRFNAPSMAGA
jgi:GT2 family glycosyltransferase